METVSENLSHDRLTTPSQSTGFRGQLPVVVDDVTEKDLMASRAAFTSWAGFGRGTNLLLLRNPSFVILTHQNIFRIF